MDKEDCQTTKVTKCTKKIAQLKENFVIFVFFVVSSPINTKQH